MEYLSSASESRLKACAFLLAPARHDAVRMAAVEIGDDTWSIGSRAYSFGKQRTAERGTYNWLTVLDRSPYFDFQIEDVPMHFFAGQPMSRPPRVTAADRRDRATEHGPG